MHDTITITVPSIELFDERTSTFISSKETTFKLKHSLYAISDWEGIWKKSFLETFEKNMSYDEFFSYVECMCITPNVNPEIFKALTKENIQDIYKYMNDPACATTFVNRDPNAQMRKKEIVTAEIVYYWMFAQQIPKECEKWHFNKLMALIRVCSIKNDPHPKKMSKAENMARHKSAVQAARARYRH